MVRKLILLAAAAAVLAVGLFWVLTIPQTVPASALGAHRADLGNGKTLFYIGGCASCHATPGQKDQTKLGGGLALNSPFGTFYPPNISSDPKDGIGVVERGGLRHRHDQGHLARRASIFIRRFPTPPTNASRPTTCATCSPI